MNILPKKRWHVLKKENIARVRADEAKYDEEQEKNKFKAQLADQEARVDYLRKQRSSKITSSTSLGELQSTSTKDIALNVFQGNTEYENEKKTEQEKKEKEIGLLTYLGQTILDAAGEKPWYDIHPKTHLQREKERRKNKEELEIKKKTLADPLTEMKKAEEIFRHNKELKKQSESAELQRASACIHAMPTLFPNDVIVPKHLKTKVKTWLIYFLVLNLSYLCTFRHDISLYYQWELKTGGLKGSR
ncbi:Leukocyte receptor cluster member 1 [Schistosoma japonicum]|nr:Leukocyte receptor cluster member 1 [Schistosoma japonicum]KAH8864160.1 Leukocyte receptor cluster member 1 [Schistosoma japonicum]